MPASSAAAAPRDVAEVAQGVYVATAAMYTTTTTIVAGDDGGCLLIDPGVSAAELGGLAGWLTGRGLRPAAGWTTHPHWDHLLWSPALGPSVPRYATPRAVAAVARDLASLVGAVNESAPGHDLDLFARVEALAGDQIDWPGPRAVVLAHDAHAPGHGAVWLPGPGVLVAGDMLSDVEIPLPDLDSRDPFGGYRHGLALLASVPGVRVLVPGHGHPGGHAELRRRVAADFGYLDAVETGAGHADPRLADPRLADPREEAGWLRAEHARHLALAARPQGWLQRGAGGVLG